MTERDLSLTVVSRPTEPKGGSGKPKAVIMDPTFKVRGSTQRLGPGLDILADLPETSGYRAGRFFFVFV